MANLAALLCLAAAAGAAQDVTWQPVTMAVLKVDDRPVRLWELYVADKQGKRILVQLGRRFLMLDTEAREVWELPEAEFERRGSNLLWRPPARPAEPARVDSQTPKPGAEAGIGPPATGAETARASRYPLHKQELLPSEDWSLRDIGQMRRIRVRLADEGRRLEVQLPIMPDLRPFY